MRPYDPSAKCSKCGHDVVSTRFVRGLTRSDDALRRDCIRCAHTWSEAPLDAVLPRALTRKRWLSMIKVKSPRRV